MSVSQVSQDPKMPLPEKWRKIPFQDYFDKGWRPRVKTDRDGRQYITLRKGNREKSLGAYSDERWFLLMEIFPKKRPPPKLPSSPLASGLLKAKLDRPKPIPTKIGLSLETLQYYTWCQQKGYKGGLTDWLEEIIHNYFVLWKGIQLAVVIDRSEEIDQKS